MLRSALQLLWLLATLPTVAPVDVAALLKTLTPAQQIAQLVQLDINLVIDHDTGQLDVERLRSLCQDNQVGSIFNTPQDAPLSFEAWRDLAATIDSICRKESPIPLLLAIDSVHGTNYIQNATLFPQQINVAATFNPDLAWEQGRVTAQETRAAGLPWIFAPILGIATQPSWPRVYETFGEDPLVASLLGAAMVRGIQNTPQPPGLNTATVPGEIPEAAFPAADSVGDLRCAATMKHFVGYPHSLTGQDRSPVWIPDPILLQYYVPPFEAAVKAGVATAMEAYTELNGVPVVSSNKYLIRLLRDHLGFQGLLGTDYNEVDNLFEWHRVVPSTLEAVAIVLRDTSVDVAMVPFRTDFPADVAALLHSGAVTHERVRESARRVLQVKADLGLFDQPTVPPLSSKRCSFACAAHRKAATSVAAESVTLLENRNAVLPLRRPRRLLLVGHAVDALAPLTGGWTFHWQGPRSEAEFGYGLTLRQALAAAAGVESVTVITALCPKAPVESTGAFGGPSLPAGWKFRDDTSSASLTLSQDAVHVSIPSPGPHPWSIALERAPITLENSVRYRVELEAASSTPCSLSIKIGIHRPPWSDLMLQPVAIGTQSFEAHHFEYLHTSEACTDDCGLYFFFVANDSVPVTIHLRSIMIRPVECASTSEVATAAKQADAIIATVGEWPYAEKPGNIFDLRLPRSQVRLVHAAAGHGPPLVLVLVEGRPRLLDGLVDLADAVMHAYLPGPAGGVALADVLLGRSSPSGRLPYSYPKTPGNAPLQYWHKASATYDVQWAFGTGLSYSSFRYTMGPVEVHEAVGEVTALVHVTNTGEVPAKVAVLLFASQDYRRVTPEVRLLVAFHKVLLAPGKAAEVTFRVPLRQLAYFDDACCQVLEAGAFHLSVENEVSTFNVTKDRHYGCSPMCTSAPRSSTSFLSLVSPWTFGFSSLLFTLTILLWCRTLFQSSPRRKHTLLQPEIMHEMLEADGATTPDSGHCS